MKDAMIDAGLKTPEFDTNGFFRAIFHRSPEFSLATTTQKKAQKSTQKILKILMQNGFVTRAALAQKTGLSDGGIKKQLEKMQKEGVLRRVGPDKGGHWEVLK